MAAVPREQFVPEAVRPIAYSDRPLDTRRRPGADAAGGLGRLLTELEPRAGERALVVGAGQCAMRPRCWKRSASRSSRRRSGRRPARRSYDLILIDGAVEEVPAALAARLA